MLASRGEAWHGNWQTRLANELAERGMSLREFVAFTQCSTYAEICDRLTGSYAPVQMMMALRVEYVEAGEINQFVVDSLFRHLVDYMRQAASTRSVRESRAAAAFAAWETALGAENEQAADSVWNRLRDRVLEGWIPSGPEDQVLVDAIGDANWKLASD
jgi:hypothetical protein